MCLKTHPSVLLLDMQYLLICKARKVVRKDLNRPRKNKPASLLHSSRVQCIFTSTIHPLVPDPHSLNKKLQVKVCRLMSHALAYREYDAKKSKSKDAIPLACKSPSVVDRNSWSSATAATPEWYADLLCSDEAVRMRSTLVACASRKVFHENAYLPLRKNKLLGMKIKGACWFNVRDRTKTDERPMKDRQESRNKLLAVKGVVDSR